MNFYSVWDSTFTRKPPKNPDATCIAGPQVAAPDRNRMAALLRELSSDHQWRNANPQRPTRARSLTIGSRDASGSR